MRPLAADLLAEWFSSTGTTQRDFATSLEIREETMSRWLAGRLMPSLVSRIAIEHVTFGRVPRTSWGAPS